MAAHRSHQPEKIMSKKPDGTSGKKQSFKASVYKAKSTKPQKKHEAIVALHAAQGGKPMRVVRGTKRAKRREGVVRGWKALVAKGIQTATMLPA